MHRRQQPRRLRPLGLHRDHRPARVQGAPRRRHRGPVRRRADHRRPGPARLRTDRTDAYAARAKKPTGRPPSTSITHGDKRTNIPTADAHDFVDPASRGGPPGRRYARDETLDPQLVWRGKFPPATSRTPTRPRRRRAADLHPGEDRPAGADREPPPHRRQPEDEPELTLFDILRRARRSSTSSTSTSTRPTGRTG